MAAEKKTGHRTGPLAAYNTRLRDFWKREEGSSPTTTTYTNSESGSQSHTRVTTASYIRRGSRRQSSDDHGPSPSVEPPQVSAYKLGPSPSPASWGANADPYADYYQSDGASMPPPQALRVDSLPLEDISEMGSGLGHREQPQQDTATIPNMSTPNESRDQSQVAAPTPQETSAYTQSAPQFQGLRRKPVKKLMHPDGSRIMAEAGHFKPPEDVINHAEVIRHGSVAQITPEIPNIGSEPSLMEGEAEYQMAITPPVNRREAPPAIVLDPAAFKPVVEPDAPSPVLTMRFDENVNTVTWVPKTTTGLAPPVPQDPMSSPLVAHGMSDQINLGRETPPTDITHVPNTGAYDISKPTCSLNLVCYRSGAKGCDLQQLQCVLRSKFPTQEGFQMTVDANKNLVHNDEQFFREMRRLFDGQMSSFMRRTFSLKSHKAFRILAYTPTTRPVVVPFDDFVLQEMMFAYLHPDKVESTDDWIQWVFRLRRRDKRHAVEFVEGWNSNRIAIAGTIPWLSSCIVGIAWTAAGGDVQSAFTVASFILTSSSIILALLAIISSIESSGRTVM